MNLPILIRKAVFQAPSILVTLRSVGITVALLSAWRVKTTNMRCKEMLTRIRD